MPSALHSRYRVKPRPVVWSGREDLNLRPLEPHSSALPVCATPRRPWPDYNTAAVSPNAAQSAPRSGTDKSWAGRAGNHRTSQRSGPPVAPVPIATRQRPSPQTPRLTINDHDLARRLVALAIAGIAGNCTQHLEIHAVPGCAGRRPRVEGPHRPLRSALPVVVQSISTLLLANRTAERSQRLILRLRRPAGSASQSGNVSPTAQRPAAPAARVSMSPVSAGSIASAACARIGPVSIPSSMRMMVLPVTWSPARMAACTGAAPRQRGSSDAWTLMQPRRGRFSTAGRNICPKRGDHDHDPVVSAASAATASRDRAASAAAAQGCPAPVQAFDRRLGSTLAAAAAGPVGLRHDGHQL